MANFNTEDKYFFLNLNLEDTERFDMAKFMLFDCDVFDPLTSFALDEIPKLASGGKIRVQGLDFRPDQISYEIYGSTQYWWILVIYNGFQSYNDIEHGQELQYPSINAVEDFYFNLKVLQGRSDRD